MRRILAVILFLLVIFCGSIALADDVHRVTFACTWQADSMQQDEPFIGAVDTLQQGITILPDAMVRDMAGNSWTLDELASAEGFELRSATLRFPVSWLYGKYTTYGFGFGNSFRVTEGRCMADATDAVRQMLSDRNASIRLTSVDAQPGRGFRMPADADLTLTVTFAARDLALFPQDRVEESVLLDAALSMLEEGNPFIERYDEVADSLLQAALPLGAPYYFGGHNEEKLLKRYYPLQPTRFYHSDRMYLYGFDCSGYTGWIREKNGLADHPSISRILRARKDVFLPDKTDTSRWADRMLPGDILAVNHGSCHILMYIGTLRMYGYTATDAGQAAGLLDYPLFIHCGGNPFYYERYREYIKEQGYSGVYAPDGGVTVSVACRDRSDAPHQLTTTWGSTYGWYDLNGYPLLVFPIDDCTQFAWWHE